MVKKIRKRLEREGVTDAPSGSEDEKAEERLVRDGSSNEKKAASPGPSGS